MQLPSVDRSTSWRPQGADLYSTGASGAVPVRPIHAANSVESTDQLGGGAIVKTPEKSADSDQVNRDWTEGGDKKELKTPPKPPQDPPLYKQLIDFIQSMWRASGSAVELAQDVNNTTLAERMAQQANNDHPTYADPSVKKSSGL